MSEKKKKDMEQPEQTAPETAQETPAEETPEVPEVEETFTVSREQSSSATATINIFAWPPSTTTIASAPPRRRRASIPMPSWKP